MVPWSQPNGSSQAQPAGGVDREVGATLFVWGVWGMMTLGAVVFVARYGTNVPVWDDENIVPVLAGAQPITWSWLWEQCNEHRIALPKLILVWADRAMGRDVRAGMFLSVAALSALAAGLLALVGRFRGGPSAADAVFPILLLHPGHATNLLWSIQFAFVLPTVLATAFLIPIAGRLGRPGVKTACGAGLALVCLALSGGNGLVFVPPLGFWLVGLAWLEARSPTPGGRRRAAGIALASVPGFVVAGLYFQGWRRGVYPEAPGGITDRLRTALQFLTGGLGAPTEWGWPGSGVATAGAGVGAVVLLARAWWVRPGERTRIFGLVALLAGLLALALAVGWGRGWAGDRAGFQGRYVTLATPFWCWLAVTTRLYAPLAGGRVVAHGFFGLVCCLAWPNTEVGLRHGREATRNARSLTQDIQDGKPPYQLIRQHTPYLYPSHDGASRLLPIMRAGKIGPFAGLRDDPPFREVALPVDPVGSSLVRWDGATAQITGVDPQITFALPKPRYVAGIRLDYSHANPQGGPARFQLAWKNSSDRGYGEDRRYANWNLPTGTDQRTTIWIDAVIDRFRVQPDNQPGSFRFGGITLLIPETAP